MADAITFERPDSLDCPSCHQLPMKYTSIPAKFRFPPFWNGEDLKLDSFTHFWRGLGYPRRRKRDAGWYIF